MTGNYQPIENYGIIGNMRTAALVGMDGSIDWLCLPHFDSPSVFAAILDDRKGGRFRIAPARDHLRRKQYYWPGTNILITRFLHADGVGEVEDYMPVGGGAVADELIRRVRMVRGEFTFRLECRPAFDYARAHHETHVTEHGIRFDGPGISLGAGRLGARSRSTARERPPSSPSRRENMPRSCSGALDRPTTMGRCPGFAAAEEMFRRHGRLLAALAVAMHLYRAAGVKWSSDRRWRSSSCRSSRPERSSRHRRAACPSRSAARGTGTIAIPGFATRRSLSTAFSASVSPKKPSDSKTGSKTAGNSADGRGTGPLQPIYGIDGRADLTEETLDHLEGYRGSGPVRIGNGAHQQLQLDIYGELMDAVYLHNKYVEPIGYDGWTRLRHLLNWLCDNWRRDDESIWEVRGGPRSFVYSKFMCWVALDRGLRLADKRSFPADRPRWLAVRDEIYRGGHDIKVGTRAARRSRSRSAPTPSTHRAC